MNGICAISYRLLMCAVGLFLVLVFMSPVHALEGKKTAAEKSALRSPTDIPGIKKRFSRKRGKRSRGRKIFVDRAKGNCLSCHAVSGFKNENFQGNVGASLDGVAASYTVAQLRQLVADARVFYPTTIMPPYFVKDDLYRVSTGFEGKTMLSAQDVEDVVAFLATLR